MCSAANQYARGLGSGKASKSHVWTSSKSTKCNSTVRSDREALRMFPRKSIAAATTGSPK